MEAQRKLDQEEKIEDEKKLRYGEKKALNGENYTIPEDVIGEN